MKPVSAMKVKR